jgi:hypothetical protein
MNVDHVTRYYIAAALWSSTGDDDTPLDQTHSADDLAPETFEAMRKDCRDFIHQAKALIIATGLDPSQVGHDFWLTRNGHGAGFWDRGLGEPGDKLTDIAKHFGEVWLYEGDDGKLYT